MPAMLSLNSIVADFTRDLTVLIQAQVNDRARATIEAASNGWLAILHDVLGDLDVARAVKLIGDGLYYNALNRALSGQPLPTGADEGLLEVVDRITNAASASRHHSTPHSTSR